MTHQNTTTFNTQTNPQMSLGVAQAPYLLQLINLTLHRPIRPDDKLGDKLGDAQNAEAQESAQTLIQSFSCAIKAGERLMISGASGCGKSSILRAAHGLWPWGSGHIATAANINKMIIAQKTHLPLLNMKGIICFPKPQDQFSDEDVAKAMTKAGLERLIPEMHDHQKDGAFWERLSGGEKQRISFARIFLHKPDLLMLDEVTASLDIKAQDELYETLIKELPQSAIISISHRAELSKFHNRYAMIENQKFIESDKPFLKIPNERYREDCMVCQHAAYLEALREKLKRK